MPTRFSVRAGTTSPIVFTLQTVSATTGAASAADLTGVTKVEMRMKPVAGGDVKSFDTEGDQLEVTDADDGQVTYSPEATDIEAADEMYLTYFLVTDASGDIASYPSDDNVELVVLEAF